MNRRLVTSAVVLVAALSPAASAMADAPAANVVVTIKPWTYSPAEIHLAPGSSLTFLNADPISGVGHSLTDLAERTEHRGRFSSAVIPTGSKSPVTGVESLPPGHYRFTCRVHPFMSGTLVIH